MSKVYLTVDLGFGDAGKGSVVDFLVQQTQAHTVVRYNGGAQAGHRVVAQVDGVAQSHVFSQFGSGTLAGARTHLSRFMLVEPLAMEAEADALINMGMGDVFGRFTIDQNALVITPFQRAVNRLRELARGANRHGSCGMGIGETMFDSLENGDNVLRIGDLTQVDGLLAKLTFMREINRSKVGDLRSTIPPSKQADDEWNVLDDDSWFDFLIDAYTAFVNKVEIVPSSYLTQLLQRPGAIVFEGAQGVLLDEWYGFHPHTTWSTTTLANAYQLLNEASFDGEIERIGITRAYSTRHGAGPFVTEDDRLTQLLKDAKNGFDTWQHGFRVGWLDLVMLRYALKVVGKLDYLAVTCLDRLDGITKLQICNRYRHNTFGVDEIVVSAEPVSLDYQAQITHALKQCRPILTPVDGEVALLEAIREATNVPLGLLSYGPAAVDKVWLKDGVFT